MSVSYTHLDVYKRQAEILHTTPEWLRGETSDLNSDVKDYMELKLIDSFNSVLKSFSNNLTEDASMFSKNMFLLLLNEFAEFNKSFEFALSNYSNNDNSDIAKTIEMCIRDSII